LLVQPLHIGSGKAPLPLLAQPFQPSNSWGSILDHLVHRAIGDPMEERGQQTKITPAAMGGGVKEILKRKVAELARVLRKRDNIAIEKSADQIDEIQYASERDLAIRNLDRDSNLLRDVKAALRRIHDGSFGTCIQCESAISPKRLAAVPWAVRCIQCQEAADRNGQDGTEAVSESLDNAA
jgi:DnaK suppressor protein